MRGQKHFTWHKKDEQMEPLLPLRAAAAGASSFRPPPLPSFCSSLLPLLPHSPSRFLLKNQSFRVQCSSLPVITASEEDDDDVAGRPKSDDQCKPGFLDDLFLTLFRNKMAKEVGWDSEKPGYDGLIDVAKRLMLTGRTNSDTRDAAVRILRSLFPPLLLDLYKLLVSPIAGGEVAALMVARVTALTCQWLMGKCTVNSVELTDGSSWESGVFVERCKYLEESKCVGICVNTCKLPTQAFFKDFMGIPLLMEPNFSDYSCQFKFGVVPPLPEDDSAFNEPCLEACPVASRRKEISKEIVNIDVVTKCPKA